MTFMFLLFAHRARPKNCAFQSRIKPLFQRSRRVGGDRCAHRRRRTRSGNVKRKSSAIPISPGSKPGRGGKVRTEKVEKNEGRRVAAEGAGAGALFTRSKSEIWLKHTHPSMMKTARFAAVVKPRGTPDTHLLLVSPEKHKALQSRPSGRIRRDDGASGARRK